MGLHSEYVVKELGNFGNILHILKEPIASTFIRSGDLKNVGTGTESRNCQRPYINPEL